MKNLFATLVVIFASCASSTNADSTSKVKDIIAVGDKYGMCITLLANANMDKFGLPLQFEVDSEFYSRSNRNSYFQLIVKKYRKELDDAGENELSEDEAEYLAQKLRNDAFAIGAKWGAKFTSQGASTWDEPIRKCVLDFDLKN